MNRAMPPLNRSTAVNDMDLPPSRCVRRASVLDEEEEQPQDNAKVVKKPPQRIAKMRNNKPVFPRNVPRRGGGLTRQSPVRTNSRDAKTELSALRHAHEQQKKVSEMTLEEKKAHLKRLAKERAEFDRQYMEKQQQRSA